LGEYYTAPLEGTGSFSYIWKQDSEGQTLWVKQLAAVDVIIKDLGTDSYGNIYVMAKYLNPIVIEDYEFDPYDWCDYIIAKLNPQGDYLWITNVGYVGSMYDFCVGPGGNCFITGELEWGTNFIGNFSLDVTGDSDMFVAKLSATGIWQWAKRASGNSIVLGEMIIADNAGGCYVVGMAWDDVTIGSIYLPEPNSFTMEFVAYFYANGTVG